MYAQNQAARTDDNSLANLVRRYYEGVYGFAEYRLRRARLMDAIVRGEIRLGRRPTAEAICALPRLGTDAASANYRFAKFALLIVLAAAFFWFAFE
jgi:hypothetical protein